MRRLPSFAASIMQVQAPLPVCEGFHNVQHKGEKEGHFPHPTVADGPCQQRDTSRLHFELLLNKLSFTGQRNFIKPHKSYYNLPINE